MTLHTYVGRVLDHAGVRYTRPLKSAIPRRCLVLRDASCDFRDVANRFQMEITWDTIYKTITGLWLPYLLCSRPNDEDVAWPLVVSLDSREHYVKEREHVQKKRGDARKDRKYASLEEALTLHKIDLTSFLNTKGGHAKLMMLYLQNTDLPLVVLNERDKEVYVVNTDQVPSFLTHKSLKVPPFEQTGEFGPRVKAQRSLVEWPGKGLCNKWGYISENDTFLPFIAQLAKEVDPRQEVCVVGRDGDYILALLLANLPIRHVWPSTKGSVVWFDIPKLLSFIPWGIRPSLAMWLYLTGSDFSEKLACAPPPAVISMSLAVLLQVHQVEDSTSGSYIESMHILLERMCFVDPVTWKFDEAMFKKALTHALSIPNVFYEQPARGKNGAGEGGEGGEDNAEEQPGEDDDTNNSAAGDKTVVCPVAAFEPASLAVVRALSTYSGAPRKLSKGRLREKIKRTKKQLDATPDLAEFKRATTQDMVFSIVSAYKAAAHYAQRNLTSLECDGASLSKMVEGIFQFE